MTLYELLGVKRHASTAQIRAAYRKVAKKAHPDAGGSPEQFGAFKHAHDILIDPVRRKRYDETGNAEPVRATNDEVPVLEGLARFLDAAIDQCLKANRDPAHGDLAGMVRQIIANTKADAQQRCAQARANRAMTERLLGRFARRDKTKPNIFEHMLRARQAGIDEFVRRLEAEIAVLDRVAAVAKEFDFRQDNHAQIIQVMQAQMIGQAQQQTYWNT